MYSVMPMQMNDNYKHYLNKASSNISLLLLSLLFTARGACFTQGRIDIFSGPLLLKQSLHTQRLSLLQPLLIIFEKYFFCNLRLALSYTNARLEGI